MRHLGGAAGGGGGLVARLESKSLCSPRSLIEEPLRLVGALSGRVEISSVTRALDAVKQ